MKAYEGKEVICNGHFGTITKVCDGKLTGMVEVRLARGEVCVDISTCEEPSAKPRPWPSNQ